MKAALQFVAWSAVAAVVLCAALNPDGGVAFQSPAAALGLGMIGLGLIKHAKEHRAGQTAPEDEL